MRARLVRLAPLTIAAAFLAALAGQLLLPGRILATRDIAQFHLPLRTALVELAHGEVPVWNPWLSGGQPIVSDPSYAVFYPPTWIAAMNSSGVVPAFSAASMIGVPWVSSAQTKCTLLPAMRCARLKMSPWM